jgi:hypothetical protein
VLGPRLLELLAFQAVVAAHLFTQDCLFCLRAVQVWLVVVVVGVCGEVVAVGAGGGVW